MINKFSSLLPKESTENGVKNIHTDVGMLRVNPGPARSTRAIMSTTTTTKDMAIVMIMRITTTTTITITNLPKIY